MAAGVLFVIATVASVLGNILFLQPVLRDPEYLTRIAADQSQVSMGALLQFIGHAACPGIALALYPVLRRYGEGLALGSVAFRVMEAVFYIAGLVGVLFLVTIGREAVAAGASDAAFFERSAALLTAGRDWLGFVAGVLFFGLGALMYYWLLYRSALVPRWLSAWGLVGASLTMVVAVLVLFDVVRPLSTAHVVLNLPVAVQEMVLAAWLIAKGFDQRALASAPAAAPAPAGVEGSLAGAGALS